MNIVLFTLYYTTIVLDSAFNSRYSLPHSISPRRPLCTFIKPYRNLLLPFSYILKSPISRFMMLSTGFLHIPRRLRGIYTVGRAEINQPLQVPSQTAIADSIESLESLLVPNAKAPANCSLTEGLEHELDFNKLSFHRPHPHIFPVKPYIPNRYVVPETWHDYNSERPIHCRDRIESKWPKESHIPEQARQYYIVEGLPRMKNEIDLPPRERFFLATEGITHIAQYKDTNIPNSISFHGEPAVAFGNIDSIQDNCYHPRAFRIAQRFLRQNSEEFELLPTRPDPDQDWEEDGPYWSQATADFILNRTHTIFHQNESLFGKAWNERTIEYKNNFRKFTQDREVFDQQEWQNWFAHVNPHYREFELLQQQVVQRETSIEKRMAEMARFITGLCEAQQALVELESSCKDSFHVPNEATILEALSDKVADINTRLHGIRNPYLMNPITAIANTRQQCLDVNFAKQQNSSGPPEHDSLTVASPKIKLDTSGTNSFNIKHLETVCNIPPGAVPESNAQEIDRFNLDQIAATFNDPSLSFDWDYSSASDYQQETIDIGLAEFGKVDISPSTTLSFKLSDRSSQPVSDCNRVSLYSIDFERNITSSFDYNSALGPVSSPPTSMGQSDVSPVKVVTEKPRKLKDRVRARLHRLREKIYLRKL